MHRIEYVPFSSSAPWSLAAANVSILLSEVEQEQRPSGNGDHEANVVEAGLCDGEGERAYTAYAPHYNIFASRTNIFSFLEDVSATKTFRRQFVAETFAAMLSPKRLSPKRPESFTRSFLHRACWPLLTSWYSQLGERNKTYGKGPKS